MGIPVRDGPAVPTLGSVALIPPARSTAARPARVLSVLSVVVGLALSFSAVASADPGGPWGGGLPTPTPPPHPTPPHPTPQPPTPSAQPSPTPTGSPTPTETPTPKGSPGTHLAHDVYGYGFPEAPDCNEASLGADCIGDDRGFFQGQCTSWVAFRLSQRNGISFSNWYAGRHWGDAVDWAKVAKSMGVKPDRTPGVGAVAWFKRGHVAYVESVNYDGSITLSEMNTDGANGFHFSTHYPSSAGWPDKFLHLHDVVPYDATAPTAPGRPRVVAHQGRVGLSWQRSADASGVVSYRVLRDGIQIGTSAKASFWDRQVSPGQAYAYAVVAVDPAGNASPAVRARLVPGAEAADRAWVSTGAGPALCGRSGSPRHQRLTCTVRTESGWKRVPLHRTTDWGDPGSRHFVTTADRDVAYCRTVGSPRRSAAACTTLDADTLTWGRDVRSSRRLPLLVDGRTWLPTAEGPAVCGLAGGPRHQRIGCGVLTSSGWRWSVVDRTTRWGLPTSRAFVPSGDRVSFCRAVATDPRHPRLSCTPFYPGSGRWGYDRISGSHATAGPVEGTWLTTSSGPALCGGARPATSGCRVLGWSGWRFVRVRPGAGSVVDQAFLPSANGGVSWCRTLRTGSAARVACAPLESKRHRWGRDQRSERTTALAPENRTWLATAAGPALCSRAGAPGRPRVGCHVLTGDGWTWSGSGTASWGNPGYRAFVGSGDEVSWCRTVGSARVSCDSLDTTTLAWGAGETSPRTDWSYADPF